ncbi:MAG: LON peptidase substrate-binding domain-containing protein, partial [Endomicrobium sp.]|nr:LON peptidase substrate-binding domain-containing protein [Endomicrobium sp.]
MSDNIIEQSKESRFPKVLPVMPIREMIVYPSMVLPLAVGRDKSIKALEESMSTHRFIFIVTQKNVQVEDPSPEDIYSVGTVCEVLQILKMPDGTLKALVEGLSRVQWTDFRLNDDGFLEVDIKIIDETVKDTPETQAVMRNAASLFEQYVKLSPRMPIEIAYSLNSVTNPARLADLIAAHLTIKSDDKQAILELINPIERLEKIIKVLNSEIEILDIERKIQSRVRNQMDKTQKEYYLNEQMKAIQKE